MKRILVLGVAVVVIGSLIACQRISRLPERFAKRTGLGTSAATQQVNDVTSPAVMRGNTGALQGNTIQVGGDSRSYYIYAPQSARNQISPVVVAFHGGGGGAIQFAERMGLVGMAERHGMILVLPQGAGRPGGGKKGRGGSWNANSISPSGYAENNNVNDIGFVDALLRNVRSSYNVDPNRVYAMGFSKGGMMAYRSACVLRGQITAIAAVSATLSSADCPNPEGVSVLHIHGTNDENVPFDGGVGQFTGGRADWPAVQRGLQYFQSGNQCSGQQSQRISSDTTCTISSCSNSEEVQLCLVQGGGHAWPGAQPAKWQINRDVYVTQSFSATDYIARFLLSH